MTAHVQPSDLVPIDRFALDTLRPFRLLPMAIVPHGTILWCVGTNCIGVSTPKKPKDPPPETSTACLSIADFRRVTEAMAKREAA